MEKNICALLSLLAFFTLQVFAQKCKTPTTITSPTETIATVKVFNNYFEPDCLTISKLQKVVWGMFVVIVL
jgi:hypothetical protein